MDIAIQITVTGGVQMLHSDIVDLRELGPLEITRASHVEYDNDSKRWYVQSARTGRILRDSFLSREDALEWERLFYCPTGPGWRELTQEA